MDAWTARANLGRRRIGSACILAALASAWPMPALARCAEFAAITKLAEGARLPESALKNCTPNEIAEAIVERARARSAKTAGPRGARAVKLDFARDAKILVAVPESLLPRIARSGLKNMHQTRSTMGHHAPAWRRKIESRLAGIRLGASKIEHAVLPKYGIVYFDAPPVPLPESSMASLSAYGSAILVLDPRIKAQSTWTHDDTLHVPDSERLHTFSEKTADLERVAASGRYLEAQIWGDVGMKDVLEIWYDDHYLTDKPDYLRKLAEAGLAETVGFCRENGIALHLVRAGKKTMGRWLGYRRIRTLVPADPELRSRSNCRRVLEAGD